MYLNLVSLGVMVLFVTPATVKLSIWRDELGWGQPILMRFWQRGKISFVLIKRDASSELAARDMTSLMI